MLAGSRHAVPREHDAGGAPGVDARVRAAVLHMRRELVVGVVERLDEFQVLLALELGWRVEAILYASLKATADERLCCGGAICAAMRASRHKKENFNRGRYHLISDEARAHIEALVAPDQAVYDAALELHAQQAARHGEHFFRALERFGALQGRVRVAKDSCTARCDAAPPANGEPPSCEARPFVSEGAALGMDRLDRRRARRRR